MLRLDDVGITQIAARALVYGLSRTLIDGHFAQWASVGSEAEETAQNALANFVSVLGTCDPQ